MSVARHLAAPAQTVSPLERIAAEVVRRTGLENVQTRREFLAEKVRQRLGALRLSTEADYLACLLAPGSEDEWEALLEAISIGETSFWRYPAQWEAMRDVVLPALRATRRGKPLRIWCAGCSTGAEPYSLAILLRQHEPNVEAGAVEIVATDICGARLARARAGLYSSWDLRAIAPTLRDACFIAEGPRWRLREEYKQGVRFHRHNLAEFAAGGAPAEPGPFDLILCRNVMIYFQTDLVRRLLRRFHACAADGGWFLTGHAESYLEIVSVFEPVATEQVTLYRKRAVAAQATQAAWSKPAARAQVSGESAAGRLCGPVRKSRPRAQSGAASPVSAPAGPEAGVARLHRLADAGQWSEAACLGEQLAERDEFNAEIHFFVALAHTHLGDIAAAEAAFGRALYLDPDFALAHFHLGMTTGARRREREAARCFRNVLSSLRDLADEAPVRAGDGVTAGDLRQYARVQLGEAPGAPG